MTHWSVYIPYISCVYYTFVMLLELPPEVVLLVGAYLEDADIAALELVRRIPICITLNLTLRFRHAAISAWFSLAFSGHLAAHQRSSPSHPHPPFPLGRFTRSPTRIKSTFAGQATNGNLI